MAAALGGGVAGCTTGASVLSDAGGSGALFLSGMVGRSTVVGASPNPAQQGEGLAAIAKQLAVVSPTRATALIDQVLAVAGTIAHSAVRGIALTAIAKHLVVFDPGRAAALVEQVMTMATTIADDGDDRIRGIPARRGTRYQPPSNPVLSGSKSGEEAGGRSVSPVRLGEVDARVADRA